MTPAPIDLREYLTDRIELLTAMLDGETSPAVRAEYACDLLTMGRQLAQLDPPGVAT